MPDPSIVGSQECAFALEGNAAGLKATTRVSVTHKRDKKELRGYKGGIKAIAYFAPQAEISVEGYGETDLDIGGTSVTGIPTVSGTITIEEITYDRTNDDFIKSSIKAVAVEFGD